MMPEDWRLRRTLGEYVGAVVVPVDSVVPSDTKWFAEDL